jgi:hypothetical protein
LRTGARSTSLRKRLYPGKFTSSSCGCQSMRLHSRDRRVGRDSSEILHTSQVQTSHEGTKIDLMSKEILTLKQTGSDWKISKIEWQSHRL